MIAQPDRDDKIRKTPLLNSRQTRTHDELESEKSYSSLNKLVSAENGDKITVLTI